MAEYKVSIAGIHDVFRESMKGPEAKGHEGTVIAMHQMLATLAVAERLERLVEILESVTLHNDPRGPVLYVDVRTP